MSNNKLVQIPEFEIVYDRLNPFPKTAEQQNAIDALGPLWTSGEFKRVRHFFEKSAYKASLLDQYYLWLHVDGSFALEVKPNVYGQITIEEAIILLEKDNKLKNFK